MESVTVKNFRCFREEQTARMAPLTFLVGENSTGKTSFLALLRALWDVAFREVMPDFREPPYDLGSFEDIAHNRGAGETADSFDVGFEYLKPMNDEKKVHYDKFFFQTSFKERQGIPFPVARSITGKDAWIKTHIGEDSRAIVKFGTVEKEWERIPDSTFPFVRADDVVGFFDLFLFSTLTFHNGRPVQDESVPRDEIQPIFDLLDPPSPSRYSYAGAPVRSQPKRTYDPIRPSPDPEGEYIPTYLANMSRRNPAEWATLKSNLEKFGQQSGLFDEIKINSFGNTSGGPFQVHIGKQGRKSGGSARNLIDVGYGVSQALPLITELFNPEPSPLFLLQQPEVHLHPSAQAALGTLFCSIASRERQLVVETHSDFIIDRVLMDIRDKTTDLRAEDVSILYFEPNDLDVTIHSLRLDDRATILDPPDSYRRFFMDELRRSVGL